MQGNNQTYAGLDIGTSKVACALGIHEHDSPAPTIVGVASVKNEGVRKGAVVDIAATAESVRKAIDEVEKLSGYKVDKVMVGVGGTHIKSLNSRGVIAVGGMHHNITAEDVARVEDAAAVIQLPPNREIVQVFSQQFRLDGQDNIKDPVGMSGVRLEVDAHIVTAATPALRNLQRSVYQGGVVIEDQVMSALAASHAVLNTKQRENGVVAIDIGASTTSIAVIEEGEVMHTAVLSIGSAHITNDLAIGMRTDLDTAEQVKIKHIDVEDNRKKHGFSIKDAQNELLHVDGTEVSEIARARVEEIFERVNRQLDHVKRAGKLPGGAVLTGGGSRLKGIDHVAKDSLRLPVAIGKPRGFSGITDTASDSAYAVAVGLMLSSMMHRGHAGGNSLGINMGGAIDSFKRFVQRLKP